MTNLRFPSDVVDGVGQRLLDQNTAATSPMHAPRGHLPELDGPLWERFSLAELVANPPAQSGYLFRGLWPDDAYGVLAAEPKAGKTWLVTDAAVSVASGGLFLGRFQVDRRGPVLLYAGEGGQRNIYRRFDNVHQI